MGKNVLEFAAKAVVLVAVLFCGIYHLEIKQSIGAALGKEERAVPDAAGKERAAKERVDKIFGGTFMSGEVAGYRTVRNYGYTCAWFVYSGHSDAYFDGLSNALNRLRADLKPEEANVLINLRLFPSTYEAQGSKWNSSLVNICADRARVEPLDGVQ